jgi:hypothetical protein
MPLFKNRQKKQSAPAPEEPKAACAPFAHPTIAIEIVSPEKIEVSCHGVCFDGGDPTGTYLCLEDAVAALDEAIADPYEIKR